MNTGGLMAMRLPTDSLIRRGFFGAMRAIQVDQIQNNLAWVQVLGELFSFRRLVAEDHDLGASNHLLQIGGKQRADVGDDFLDVLTVGARETSKRDIPIP